MSSRVYVALRVAVAQERAFHVFVNHIGDWWQPHALFRTAPGQPGTLSFTSGPHGKLLATAADGRVYPIGRIIDWSPPRRLVFTWRQPDFPEGLSTEVEVNFEALAERLTRVSVEHRGFHRVPADSAARHGFPDAALQQRLAEWWRRLLERLADQALGQDGSG